MSPDDVIRNADCPSHLIFRAVACFVAGAGADAGGVVAGLPGARHATRTSNEVISKMTKILTLFIGEIILVIIRKIVNVPRYG